MFAPCSNAPAAANTQQRVTLGGTGKETGDRHPKIADNVLIGACTTVLGNIHIGEGALIAPGSLVLKAVPANAMVAGSPAQQVGERQMQLLVRALVSAVCAAWL